MFQSLFYWNLLSYAYSTSSMTSRGKVSILVLLEPPLIHFFTFSGGLISDGFNPCFTGTSSHTLYDTEGEMDITGFNPCFTGTSSHTSVLIWHRDLGCQVSILVLLEPPLIRIKRRKGVPVVFQFQSLFYWNLLSYLFVLVIWSKYKSFQSLFYWNLLSYARLTLTRCTRSCFNPCFTGTSSHTCSWSHCRF